ncbi:MULTISPECIES: DUF819 domain-containing protein [Brevibacterium]|uniref:DUF819 domain-containing protein n=1 Tax=Brevibacterium casei TaxID=33889 RepID=A0A7T3ZZI5_9MICO|nr:DUF819 family protein [Brevibacterium casei]QQB14574.1 DUF819 domain-containing protein [Brevibacterium casei]
MISDGFLFISVLIAIAAALVIAGHSGRFRIFAYVPGFVFLYIIAALLNTVGVFDHSDSVTEVGDGLRTALLPAMILLLLFKCDIRQIIRLGPKLLLTFAVTAASIVAGFLVSYLILRSVLDPEAWKALGALNASWTGGSANMVAVQEILQAPEDVFGYVLIVDTVIYSFWLLLIFSSVTVSDRFNRWTKADTSKLEVASTAEDEEKPLTMPALFGLLGFALLVSALAIRAGELLPEIGTVINASTWTILIVSVLGLIIGSTRFGRVRGSSELATIMLYIIIGIIASGSDFTSLTQAPLYLVAGLIVIVVHAAIMLVYAKLTKTELFSIAVASTANIGGIASAPVVAGAFNRQLVPVGVLFALMGTFLGTFLGLASAQIMSGLG